VNKEAFMNMQRFVLKTNIVLAGLLGSMTLCGMENSNQLMVLPIEKREDIYKHLNNVDLCLFSGTSKENHIEIYAFKKRNAGIKQLKDQKKSWDKSDSMYLQKNNFQMSLKCSVQAACCFRAMMTQKRNMRMTRQPWMIKNT
jgi:hypothetical protein